MDVDKITKTGRQRKKSAARTKSGNFPSSKRRLYCCVFSKAIDLERLEEDAYPLTLWNTKMYHDVLHLCHDGAGDGTLNKSALETLLQPSAGEMHPNVREIFIFEFGVAVMWGLGQSDEEAIIAILRDFVGEDEGLLSAEEFAEGEDDMAFLTSPEAKDISISNDIIMLPESCSVKSRLSLSFAIAQSSVLALFEARVERRVKSYQNIPEALARSGRVKLSSRHLSIMIGDIFTVRHDVNLHSEILDVPDFFWREEEIVGLYVMTSGYLEMSARTEVLNKRLDMLFSLLRVLQQQQESASSVKLEWVVIWLIVASVVVECLMILIDISKPYGD